jgi:hypothetical protein
MALPSFFKINKNKRFNFIPRYYDPRKEDLEERIRSVEREMGVKEGEAYRPTIRKGQMSFDFLFFVLLLILRKLYVRPYTSIARFSC